MNGLSQAFRSSHFKLRSDMPDPTALEFTLREAAVWALRLLVDNTLRYVIFAGVTWILAYDLFRRPWFHRKVIARWPALADVRREILWSALTILVYVAVGLLSIAAMYNGYGRMYFAFDQYSGTWFVVSVVLAIILHDAWFYWIHRLLHHPRFFRRWHQVHHDSVNPTPWAAYAFSPVEALLQAMILPVLIFLIPIHLLAFMLLLLWQILWNVVDHAGFEYAPRWLLKSRIGRLWITPTAHVMHHELPHGNYGLYFTFWDRLMGTQHVDYKRRFEEITTRTRQTDVGTPESVDA